MFRFHWLAVCVVMFVAVAFVVPAQAALYTFENLTSGANLIGQDNWVHFNTGATSGSEALVLFGTGSNTSKVFSPNQGNVQVGRANDANFSVPTFTGTEQVYLEADMQFGTQQANFAAAHVVPDSQAATSRSMSPIIGWQPVGTPPNNPMHFSLRKANFGTTTVIGPIADVAPEIVLGDWVRIRMELNLAANGGDGSASVFYKDLTQGQTSFTPIPGLQNLAAGLLANNGNDYFWDGMYLRGGISAGNNPMDNLEVGVIPEPTSVGLLAMAFVALAAPRRKKG
jgi:hypothetical protein